MKSPFKRVSAAVRRRFDRVFPIATVPAAEADGIRFGEPMLGPRRLEDRLATAAPPEIAIDLPERRCLFIDGGLLWPANGIAADHRGRVIVETAWSADRLAKTRDLGGLGRFPLDVSTTVATAATAIELGGWWTNYYHVMIDVLPRIMGLYSEECRSLDSIGVHLCALSSPSWRPLVEALIPENAGIRHSPWDSRVRCRQAIALPLLSGDTAGCLPPAWLTRFHAATARLWGAADASQPRRLYITRRLATMRRILNEGALVAGLRSCGFEPITLEKLSLAEQFHCFATAEAVVAPHGAGLTNLLHAPAGCRVVELFPAAPAFHYRWLSHACSHPYACLTGNAATRNADFTVDIDAVMALVTTPPAG
jgi:hypothetical protein